MNWWSYVGAFLKQRVSWKYNPVYEARRSYTPKTIFIKWTQQDTDAVTIVSRRNYMERIEYNLLAARVSGNNHGKQLNKNSALRTEASQPPVRLRRHQHNGRRLWTTDSERHTSYTTVDNTPPVTWRSRSLGGRQLWSDAKVEQEAAIFEHILHLKPKYTQMNVWGRIWMRQQNRCQLPNSVP